MAVWLTEDFDGGRHLRRIEKLDEIDPLGEASGTPHGGAG